MDDRTKCPFSGARAHTNRDWWPDGAGRFGFAPEFRIVRIRWGEAFDYAKEFRTPRPQGRDQGPAPP